MRKTIFRTLLLSAILIVFLIPGSASAKTANASATPAVSGASYTTTVKIHLNDIPDDGTAKASEAARFSSGYVSISSTGYSTYLRVKFTPQNGAEVNSVVATITSSGTATPVQLDLYDTASSGLLTYRGKISGTVTQVDINLTHVCKYDYTQIPATTTKATCTEDGTLTRTCIYCKGTDTQINEKATGHAFTKKITEEKYLHSEATCTEDATYVYSCCYCGEKGTETFANTGTATGHDWIKDKVIKDATCTENGQQQYRCTNDGCDGTKTEVIPAAGHQYSDYVSNNDATCTDDGTKTAICTVCSDKHTIADPGSAKGHQWDSGVVTKKPTEEETGIKTFTCTVCSTTRTEEIAKTPHVHAYTESVVKDIYLERSASCTSAATYYKSCKCGAPGTETFESGSPLPHKFTNYVYDNNATCTEDGTKTATCDSCGQAKDTAAAEGTATGHLWDEGTVTAAPTVDHEGEMTYTCQNCHTTKTEILAKLELEKPDPASPDPSNDNTKPAAGKKDQTKTASTDAARTTTTKAKSPQTNDDSSLTLWIALLLLSGASLTGAGVIRRFR